MIKVVYPHRKISAMAYNHLNLPVKITFTGGETIAYTYLADGTKLKKTATDSENNTTTTEYRDGFQYKNNILEFFPHSEGYVKNTESVNGHVFNYIFTHTDHLGNIRIKYTRHPQTGEIQILEEDHYYPYGLKHQGYNGGHQVIGIRQPGPDITLIDVTPDVTDTYKYKFNGMEWQDEFDINLYDFGARNYDPALGRWMNMDPMAEAMRRHSPYNFAFNNPVYFIDPDGMMPLTTTIGLQTSSFEFYDFTGSSSGFDVRTYDKATGKTLDFTTVSSLDNVSYDSQSGAISTNNSSAYQSFFQGVGDYAANADVSLGGGCPDGDCGGNEKSVVWKDTNSSNANSENSSFNTASNAIGALNFSTGIKNEIIELALIGNKLDSRTSQYLNLSKGVGTGLGIVNGGINTYEYRSGEISGVLYSTEMISTGISARIPAWGIGWELGRIITNIPGYQEKFRQPIRRFLGLD